VDSKFETTGEGGSVAVAAKASSLMAWWWVARGKSFALIATRQHAVRTPTTVQEDGRIAVIVNSAEINVTTTECVQSTECDKRRNVMLQKATNKKNRDRGPVTRDPSHTT